MYYVGEKIREPKLKKKKGLQGAWIPRSPSFRGSEEGAMSSPCFLGHLEFVFYGGGAGGGRIREEGSRF